MSVATVLALSGCPVGPQGDAKKSDTRLELAKDFLRKGELDAAEQEANKALAFLASNEEAYNLLGLVDILRALDTTRLLEVDDCLTGVDAEALRSDIDGYFVKADERFVRATKLAEDYGEAWANRGLVASLSDNPTQAIDYLTHALGNPARLLNIAKTRADLGWAFFHKEDHVRAAKELLQALQFHPGMCVATYRLGRVYFARKEWEKAAEKFQDVSRQPACGSQEASLYLMKTLIAQGSNEEARTARDACLSLSPRSCIALQCRAEGQALGETGIARDEE